MENSNGKIVCYKLFRKDANGNLHPLYIGAKDVVPIGRALTAVVGPIATDGKHVRSKLGNLALRPGWHCCELPYAGHIGKKQPNGELYQDPDTVWCEVEVLGNDITEQVHEFAPNHKWLTVVPNGYYWCQTNSRAKVRWLIARQIKVCRELTQTQVDLMCRLCGIEPQPVADKRSYRGGKQHD